MGEGPEDPRVSLSGYLPRGDLASLSRLGEPLYAAYLEAKRTGDATHTTVRYACVGVIQIDTVKDVMPGDDRAPVVAVKFIAIEHATTGEDTELLQKTTLRLRSERLGDAPPLEAPDGGQPFTEVTQDGDQREVPASGGQQTKRAAKKAAQLAAAPEFKVEE